MDLRSLLSIDVDEAILCAALLDVDRETLLRLQQLSGINECPVDCVPVYVPCPKHTTWARWYADLSELPRAAKLREIARRWEEQTAEVVNLKEVRHAFRREDPTNCDCPVRILPCRHVVTRSWYLPLQGQIILRRLLDPSNVEPALAPAPSLVMQRRAKVEVMAQRVAAHQQPLHPDDALQRDLFWGARRMEKSKKKHGAPAEGPFARRDGEHAA
jgi:hypothetical protein